MMTKMVSTKIPDELAIRMKKYQFMNWSGFLRTVIEQQIQLFESGENRLLINGDPIYTQLKKD